MIVHERFRSMFFTEQTNFPQDLKKNEVIGKIQIYLCECVSNVFMLFMRVCICIGSLHAP